MQAAGRFCGLIALSVVVLAGCKPSRPAKPDAEVASRSPDGTQTIEMAIYQPRGMSAGVVLVTFDGYDPAERNVGVLDSVIGGGSRLVFRRYGGDCG